MIINYERTPYKVIGRHGSRVQRTNAHRQREWRRAKSLARNYPQFDAPTWLTLGQVLPPSMLTAGPYSHDYDINGKPIGMMQASALLTDIDARRIGLTQIGDYEVSTVHIPGPSHYTPDGRPLIFETMVSTVAAGPVQRWLTTTKKRARVMHAQVCNIVHRGELEEKRCTGGTGMSVQECKASDLCDCFEHES